MQQGILRFGRRWRASLQPWLACFAIILGGVEASAQPTNAQTPTIDATERPCLRIAYSQYEDNEERYDAFANYLGEKLACPVERQDVSDYDFQAISAGMNMSQSDPRRIDVAWLTPLTYVKVRQLADAEPIVSCIGAWGGSSYSALFVYRDDYPDVSAVVNALMTDPTKRVALVHENSTSGYLWPVSWLIREMGFDLQVRRDQMYLAERHPRALQALLEPNNNVVAAAVWAPAYHEAQREVTTASDVERLHAFERLRFEQIQPPIPQDPIAVRRGLAAALRTRLLLALEGMDADRSGRTLLATKFKDRVTRWVKTTDAEYDSVRAALRFAYPPSRLDLDLAVAEADLEREKYDKDLRRELRDGWFEFDGVGPPAVRARVGLSGTADRLAAEVRLTRGVGGPETVDRIVDSTTEELAQQLLVRMKREVPLQAYVSESSASWRRDGMTVMVGRNRGVRRGFLASILRRDSRAGGASDLSFLARVTSIEDNISHLTPISILDGSGSDDLAHQIVFDPADTIFFVATILPQTTDSTLLPSVEEVGRRLDEAGNLSTDVVLSIRDLVTGQPAKLGEGGLLLDYRVVPPARWAIASGPSTLALQELLTDHRPETLRTIITPVTTMTAELVTVPSEAVGSQPRRQRIWASLALFLWAMLGGAFGGTLSESRAFISRTRRKRLIFRILTRSLLGAAIGSTTLFVLLAIPPIRGLSSSAVNLASWMVCVVVGLAAGNGGTTGLGKLLQIAGSKIGLK